MTVRSFVLGTVLSVLLALPFVEPRRVLWES